VKVDRPVNEFTGKKNLYRERRQTTKELDLRRVNRILTAWIRHKQVDIRETADPKIFRAKGEKTYKKAELMGNTGEQKGLLTGEVRQTNKKKVDGNIPLGPINCAWD